MTSLAIVPVRPGLDLDAMVRTYGLATEPRRGGGLTIRHLGVRGMGLGRLVSSRQAGQQSPWSEPWVAIHSACLSRRHARLVVRGSDLLVEDLGSSGGTLVGREWPVRSAVPYDNLVRVVPSCPMLLLQGDWIWLGPDVALVVCAS